MTPAFSAAEARALLDAPAADTRAGLRDRALLSVGLQAGPRRSASVRLTVRDCYKDRGLDVLRFVWKGRARPRVARFTRKTAQRLRDDLAAAGQGDDRDGPLFRPLRRGGRAVSLRRAPTSKMVDVILKRYVRQVGLRGTHSAHSMRATFSTRTLASIPPG